MRYAFARDLASALVLVCALASGCDQGFDDAVPAPMCNAAMGCPEGTQCIDGVRCAPMPDAEIPLSPPRAELLGPIIRPSPQRRDAGVDAGRQQGQDAGPSPPTCTGAQTLCGSVCVDLRNDTSNCGACNAVCGSGQVCDLGVCCSGTQTVCGNRCVDLQTDTLNCGVCGFQCILGLTCVFGTCTPPSPTPLPF